MKICNITLEISGHEYERQRDTTFLVKNVYDMVCWENQLLCLYELVGILFGLLHFK